MVGVDLNGQMHYLLSSRHDGAFGDSGNLAPLLSGRYIKPIPIRRADYLPPYPPHIAMHRLFSHLISTSYVGPKYFILVSINKKFNDLSKLHDELNLSGNIFLLNIQIDTYIKIVNNSRCCCASGLYVPFLTNY